MSDIGYLLWFLGTAVATAAVLVIGTLLSAGLIPRRSASSSTTASEKDSSLTTAGRPSVHRGRGIEPDPDLLAPPGTRTTQTHHTPGAGRPDNPRSIT